MAEAEELMVTYSLTISDLVSLKNHFSWLKPPWAYLLFISSFIAIGPYLLCHIFRGLCKSLPWPNFYYDFVFNFVVGTKIEFVPIFFLYYSFVNLILLYIGAWQQFRNNPTLCKDVTAKISNECLISTTKTAESRVSWASVVKVTENKKLIIIQIAKSPPMGLGIPKRAFSSVEQAENFYQFALKMWKTHVPSN
jgi:hypothetical protein